MFLSTECCGMLYRANVSVGYVLFRLELYFDSEFMLLNQEHMLNKMFLNRK
jgi:hypothetical protein